MPATHMAKKASQPPLMANHSRYISGPNTSPNTAAITAQITAESLRRKAMATATSSGQVYR